LDELKSRPPQTPPKEGLANTQGPMIEKFLFVWICNNADVVDIKFGFALSTVPLHKERDKRVRPEDRRCGHKL